MVPLLFPALLVSITFAEQPPSSNSVTHEARMYGTFDFITRVPSAASFSSTDSGFVECAIVNDCGPPNMNVHFFPRRSSLQIYGHPTDGIAKLTIIPMNRELSNHNIFIVGTGGHSPLPCSSSSLTVIFVNRHYRDTLTLVFDEPIMEITLRGPITKYEGGIRTGNAEVFIPYESLESLMRITGRIAVNTLSFSLKDSDDVETTFFIQPIRDLETTYDPIKYIRFSKAF